jgi:hypothetical protein
LIFAIIDFDARGREDSDAPSFLRTVFGDVLSKALPVSGELERAAY